MTDEGVSCLGSLPRLTSVNLGGCSRVSGNSLGSLASGCPHLAFLVLDDCSALKDGAMQHVGCMAALHSLSLAGCAGVGDEGLQVLGGLCRLSSLTIGALPLVTDRCVFARCA